jgi:hypothetical protein
MIRRRETALANYVESEQTQSGDFASSHCRATASVAIVGNRQGERLPYNSRSLRIPFVGRAHRLPSPSLPAERPAPSATDSAGCAFLVPKLHLGMAISSAPRGTHRCQRQAFRSQRTSEKTRETIPTTGKVLPTIREIVPQIRKATDPTRQIGPPPGRFRFQRFSFRISVSQRSFLSRFSDCPFFLLPASNACCPIRGRTFRSACQPRDLAPRAHLRIRCAAAHVSRSFVGTRPNERGILWSLLRIFWTGRI